MLKIESCGEWPSLRLTKLSGFIIEAGLGEGKLSKCVFPQGFHFIIILQYVDPDLKFMADPDPALKRYLHFVCFSCNVERQSLVLYKSFQFFFFASMYFFNTVAVMYYFAFFDWC